MSLNERPGARARARYAVEASVIWLVAGVLLIAGCGPRERLVRVSGAVTFEGQPLSEGMVLFRNDQIGVHMTAEISAGRYEVITARGAGLPPGDYTVAITPPIDDPPVGPILEPPKPRSFPEIPHRYRDAKTSGFAVQLVAGEQVADFALRRSPD